MKRMLCAAALALLVTSQACAANEQQPENITSKMAMKFGRGVTNMVTAPVEIPKQITLMGRDMGGVGYVVGPFSGILMTGYRFIAGATEAIFFMVPAPGYYDSLTDPEYVWVGWGAKRQQSVTETTEQ